MPLLRIAIANNARKSEYTYIIKGSYLMYTSHLRYMVDNTKILQLSVESDYRIDRMIHGYVYGLFIS